METCDLNIAFLYKELLKAWIQWKQKQRQVDTATGWDKEMSESKGNWGAETLLLSQWQIIWKQLTEDSHG